MSCRARMIFDACSLRVSRTRPETLLEMITMKTTRRLVLGVLFVVLCGVNRGECHRPSPPLLRKYSYFSDSKWGALSTLESSSFHLPQATPTRHLLLGQHQKSPWWTSSNQYPLPRNSAAPFQRKSQTSDPFPTYPAGCDETLAMTKQGSALLRPLPPALTPGDQEGNKGGWGTP